MVFLWWYPLDIWRCWRQLWSRCNTGHIFGVNNPQQFYYMLHIFFCSQVYCCGVGNIVSVSSTLSPTPSDRLTFLLTKGLIQTYLSFWFYDMSVLHGNPCVLINNYIEHFGQIVVLCYWLGVCCHILLDTVGCQLWCVLHLFVYIPHSFLMSCIIWYLPHFYWLCFHPMCCILVFIICDDECEFWVLPFCRWWGLPFDIKFYPCICSSLCWIDFFDVFPWFSVSLRGFSCVFSFVMSFPKPEKRLSLRPCVFFK